MSPRWGSTRLTDRQSQCDFHFDFEPSSCRSTEEHKKSAVEREWKFSQLSVEDSHGKLVVEEELDVGLWRPNL
jgi:hypothetical protein